MARFFVSRQWRLRNVFFFLILLELPFTVANLALFGIAAPNLYRTILWRIGGEMGFNSDPKFVLYAYANYRPVTIPLVWSGFNTQYHLVIGVLCTFFWLIKSCMWLLKVFYPIFSFVLHSGLLALWAYGIYIQTSPDTIDPAHQNKGAPWYITKSCNIVESKTNRAYCMQAKSSFVVSVIMLSIYAIMLLLTIYSLVPTAAAKEAHATKRAEKQAEKEKWAHSPTADDNEMSPEQQWQHMWELQQLPRTPGMSGGMKSPMTPRTRTFEELNGGGGYQQVEPQQAVYGGAGGHYSGMQPAHGGYFGGAPVQQATPLAEHEQFISYDASQGKAHHGHAY